MNTIILLCALITTQQPYPPKFSPEWHRIRYNLAPSVVEEFDYIEVYRGKYYSNQVRLVYRFGRLLADGKYQDVAERTEELFKWKNEFIYGRHISSIVPNTEDWWQRVQVDFTDTKALVTFYDAQKGIIRTCICDSDMFVIHVWDKLDSQIASIPWQINNGFKEVPEELLPPAFENDDEIEFMP